MAEQFLEQAAADNKLVLLDFGAEWCSTCEVVDRLLESAWPGLDSRLLWVKEGVLWRKSGYFQVRELEAALVQPR